MLKINSKEVNSLISLKLKGGKMNKQAKYIKAQLKRLNTKNISICCHLSDNELKELSKYFEIKKELFGYYNFKLRG